MFIFSYSSLQRLKSPQKTAAEIKSQRAKNLKRHLQEKKNKIANMAALDKKESGRNHYLSFFLYSWFRAS